MTDVGSFLQGPPYAARTGLVGVTDGNSTMDRPDLVITSLSGTPEAGRCQQCGGPLVRRVRGRRDARFCRATCRVAWHHAKRAATFTELEATIARAAALVRELRGGRDR